MTQVEGRPEMRPLPHAKAPSSSASGKKRREARDVSRHGEEEESDMFDKALKVFDRSGSEAPRQRMAARATTANAAVGTIVARAQAMTPLRNLGHAVRGYVPATDIHLPEFELSGLERPRMELPDAISDFDWPRIDLPSLDVGKAIAGAAAGAGVGRHARRPRWPLAVAGLVIAGLAGWAVLSQDALRVRLTRGAQAFQERISAIRSDVQRRSEGVSGRPIAFSAAQTAPIEISPFADGPTVEATGYPAGLGSTSSDGPLSMAESSSPT